MPNLEIHLLGPPRVLVSGRALRIRRRKALALIAFLALSRTPPTRESLAAMFWPEAGREGSQGQLRNHLWVLRKAGLEPWLSTDGDAVELRQGEGVRIDVRELRRLLGLAGLTPGRSGALSSRAEAYLSEAVESFGGHFLAGFHISDSLPFEEWQLCEEEALRASQGAALDALTRLREGRGDLEGAMASARRRMELDPLDERALRTLMELSLRMGRRSEALRWYEGFSKLLERELKLAPGPETIQLRDRIASGSQVEIRRPAPNPPSFVLPEPPTPFVGREEELRQITRFLDEPGCRLLTLIGPGGCGKTRLALEAGRRLSARFPDGVVFVPLASVESGRMLPSALAEVLSHPLGTRERGISPAGPARAGSSSELTDYLREKRILLILDNVEHLANDLGSLREILAGTRDPVVMATSRSRLRLAGDRVLEVEGLPWPRRRVPRDDLPGHASVELFLQAVRRIRSPFAPSPAEMIAAAEVCRRLRGHPLGIELAATWAHSLSVPEIAEQLARNLDLEAAPKADVAPRHRSLRAVFEQSWALLSPEERTGFRRLCLSVGSFDRDAASEIGRIRPRVFASLIEQSFLRRTRDRRVEILETLRQFGREKLAENVREEAETRDRAARHYLGRLIESRASLEGASQKRTLRRLALDGGNLRRAWLRSAERGRITEMTSALRPLFLFYDMSGRAAAGAEVFGSAVRRLTAGAGTLRPGAASRRSSRLVAISRVAHGWFNRHEHPDRSRALVRQGRKDLYRVGTPIERAFADVVLGILGPVSSGGMRALREDALACEKAGDLWCAGLCWEVLSFHLRAHDPNEAFRVLDRSLALRRRCRDPWSVASGLHTLGTLLEARALFHGARRRYQESLALVRRLGTDPEGTLYCLEALTRMALREGGADEARRHGAEALLLAEQLGNVPRIGLARMQLAQAHYLGGTPAEARSLLESALIVARETGRVAWTCHLQAVSGIVALEMGEIEEAQWSLERALEAVPPGADPDPASLAPEILLRSWSTGWRDLLAGRLALLQGDPAACRQALPRALRSAIDSRHQPLLWETLAAWAEMCLLDGREDAAARLGAALLSHPVASEHQRARLEALLRRVGQDPEAERAAPAEEPPSATLLALGAQVISEEQTRG